MADMLQVFVEPLNI